LAAVLSWLAKRKLKQGLPLDEEEDKDFMAEKGKEKEKEKKRKREGSVARLKGGKETHNGERGGEKAIHGRPLTTNFQVFWSFFPWKMAPLTFMWPAPFKHTYPTPNETQMVAKSRLRLSYEFTSFL